MIIQQRVDAPRILDHIPFPFTATEKPDPSPCTVGLHQIFQVIEAAGGLEHLPLQVAERPEMNRPFNRKKKKRIKEVKKN